MSAWPPPPLDPTHLQRPWRRHAPHLNTHDEPERLPGYIPCAIVIGLVLAIGVGILHFFG